VLPERFHSLTKTELAMTTLAQSSTWLFVGKGGKNCTLRFQNYAIPMPPATLLPTSITSLQKFNVAIVGAYIPAQFFATIEKYSIWNKSLKAILDFYKSNNPCYEDVEITPLLDVKLDSIIDQLDENNMPDDFAEAANSLDIFGKRHVDNFGDGHTDTIFNVHDEGAFNTIVENSSVVLD
jgi:hypothetical protein